MKFGFKNVPTKTLARIIGYDVMLVAALIFLGVTAQLAIAIKVTVSFVVYAIFKTLSNSHLTKNSPKHHHYIKHGVVGVVISATMIAATAVVLALLKQGLASPLALILASSINVLFVIAVLMVVTVITNVIEMNVLAGRPVLSGLRKTGKIAKKLFKRGCAVVVAIAFFHLLIRLTVLSDVWVYAKYASAYTTLLFVVSLIGLYAALLAFRVDVAARLKQNA